MMINKRLVGMLKDSKKYIALNVLFQWISMLSNVGLMIAVSLFLSGLYNGEGGKADLTVTLILAIILIPIRYGMTILSNRMSFLSSKEVKKTLRTKIYEKLSRLGVSYNQQVHTSEVVQMAVEGVDQLETYFGAYLPQFFYAMLAPVTLFVILAPISLSSAVVLLVCVPLIPIAIAAVQTWAKKLLSRYWNQYTTLGDTFLENLQGLTTLKIYQADNYKNDEMNAEAEKFRKITMKVLTMQLNSITIMDLIAYGGAALGMIMAVRALMTERVALSGCILIILLAADFFLPMRTLGSYFHVAMNGMAASDKIFHLLDLPEPEKGTKDIPESAEIKAKDLSFSYSEDKSVLKEISFSLKPGSFTAITGESGCGKSTLASLLMGKYRGYTGSLTIGEIELSDLSETQLMRYITYVGHQSYLFKGTVRDNLLMGAPESDDNTLWDAVKKVKLDGFLKSEQGLDTILKEQASNLSGGQRQRLALARALLHDSPVYIFDEATSNVDVESENDIMSVIHALAKEKTIILISHRLQNGIKADQILMMDSGIITESGTHYELLNIQGKYYTLWQAQKLLENYCG